MARAISSIFIIGSPSVSMNRLKKVFSFFPDMQLFPYLCLDSITSSSFKPLLFNIMLLLMLNITYGYLFLLLIKIDKKIKM